MFAPWAVGFVVIASFLGLHIPVFDKSAGSDGSFERADVVYDHEDDSYISPDGNRLRRFNRNFSNPRTGIDKDGSIRYRALSRTARHAPGYLHQPSDPANAVTVKGDMLPVRSPSDSAMFMPAEPMQLPAGG